MKLSNISEEFFVPHLYPKNRGGQPFLPILQKYFLKMSIILKSVFLSPIFHLKSV